MDKTLIAKITIPNYIKEVQISNKQREKYYEWDGITIKSKSKKLLQKYINNKHKDIIIKNNGNVTYANLKENYYIIGFKGKKAYNILYPNGSEGKVNTHITPSELKKSTKFILCEVIDTFQSIEYKKIIANETQAGKPKNWIIKGQDFYVGLNPFVRAKIVNEIKLSYYNVLFLKDNKAIVRLINKLKYSYPLIIEMEIRDTIRNQFGRQPKDESNPGIRWDVGNRAEPYMKTFLDFLTNGYKDDKNNFYFPPLIVDDDRLHISSGNNAFFTPIKEKDTPSLIFYIYKDTRSIWGYWFNKYKTYINI